MNSANILNSALDSIRRVLAVFKDGADTNCVNAKSDNSACGGTLNFRTGMFDDGTDASGWYEDD